MPVTGVYTFLETVSTLQIQIPLKGVSLRNVDVFATERFLKVSYPPYLIEIDLKGAIDDLNSKAAVKNGVLVIKIPKLVGSVGLWGRIAAEKGEETQRHRQESIAAKTKREQELQERIKARKHEDERKALRQQMSVEEAERQRIEDLKLDEKRRAEEDMYRTLTELKGDRRAALRACPAVPAAAGAENAAVPAPPSSVTASRTGAGAPHSGGGGDTSGSGGGGGGRKDNSSGKTNTGGRGSGSGAESDNVFNDGADDANSGENGGGDGLPVASGKALQGEGSADAIWSGSESDETTSDDVDEDEGDDGGSGGSSDDEAANWEGRSEHVDCIAASAAAASTSSRSVPAGAATVSSGKKGRAAIAAAEDDADVRYVPAPRSARRVAVGFTPRVFPTPLRESKTAEEEEWVIRNHAHLRRNRVPGVKALDIAESDPVWLKAKGDDFYRSGDLQSAASAYTAALDATADDPAATAAAGRAAGSGGAHSDADAAVAARTVACLSNRAACYLRLAELEKCATDCTFALKLLGVVEALGDEAAAVAAAAAVTIVLPPAASAVMVAKLLARRGAAFSHKGDYALGAADFRRAALLVPDHAALAADADVVSRLARCAALKQAAEAALADGHGDGASETGEGSSGGGGFAAACELYTQALAVEPGFVSCLSNRAACHLALGRPAECEDDCTRALVLLQGGALAAATASAAGTDGSALAPGAGVGDAVVVAAPMHGGGVCGGAGAGAGGGATGALGAVGLVPPPGSEKRRQWVMATLARRGAARVRRGLCVAALEDYKAAAALAPADEVLAGDVARLRAIVEEESAAAAAATGMVEKVAAPAMEAAAAAVGAGA